MQPVFLPAQGKFCWASPQHVFLFVWASPYHICLGQPTKAHTQIIYKNKKTYFNNIWKYHPAAAISSDHQIQINRLTDQHIQQQQQHYNIQKHYSCNTSTSDHYIHQISPNSDHQIQYHYSQFQITKSYQKAQVNHQKIIQSLSHKSSVSIPN